MDAKFAAARILIIDDEKDDIALVRRILESDGYADIQATCDPTEAAELVLELEPDLVLLDLLMPGCDGRAVLRRLQEPDVRDPLRPVLVLTSDHSRQAQRDAWAAGAKDFVTKPLSPSEVRLRVRNLIETRMLHLALRDHNERLADRVRERTVALEEARFQLLERLARAAEYRDDDTGHHTRRVGRAAGSVARALGLDVMDVGRIQMAAPLHDVGKIGVPDDVLLCPGPLTVDAFEVMKRHCVIGATLLHSPDVPLLELAAQIALSHHERWDGTGYPNGLHGEDIPLAARIVAVVDMFDALTHARPYKEAWSAESAIEEIDRQSARAFDPEVVDAFHSVVEASYLEVA